MLSIEQLADKNIKGLFRHQLPVIKFVRICSSYNKSVIVNSFS